MVPAWTLASVSAWAATAWTLANASAVAHAGLHICPANDADLVLATVFYRNFGVAHNALLDTADGALAIECCVPQA